MKTLKLSIKDKNQLEWSKIFADLVLEVWFLMAISHPFSSFYRH